MARKNLLTGLMVAKLPSGNSDADGASNERLRLGQTGLLNQGPIGAVSRSIEQLKQQVTDARNLQESLAAGLAVVELDPHTIDPSFVADRLEAPEDMQRELRDSIRDHGQQVPILVRPHPGQSGRYQVAYGHRRLKAVASLGLRVRAVVRDLTNEELVVAQGLENSARTNLSFIERALYAARLEEEGFSRDTIMAALAIDKTGLSKLIAVPSKLPRDVLLSIGAAPKIGRDRWLLLVEFMEKRVAGSVARDVIAAKAFQGASSDERFDLVFKAVSAKPRTAAGPDGNVWRDGAGAKIGQVSQTPRALVITIDRRSIPGFADFVRDSLPGLMENFRSADKKI